MTVVVVRLPLAVDEIDELRDSLIAVGADAEPEAARLQIVVPGRDAGVDYGDADALA